MTASASPAPSGGSPLLDYRAAAARLGVSRRTFAAWVAAGRIPCVRLPGRVRRIRAADLEALVARSIDARRSA